MEVEVVVFLQGNVFLARRIHATHEVLDTRTLPVMDLVLVLLAVGKFFLHRARDVLAQFVTVVHAGKAAERTGEEIALLEGVRALVSKVLREDIRSRREENPAHVLLGIALGEFLQVLLEFPLGRSPGKVSVAHVKARFCKAVHHLRAGKGFGEEHEFRALFLHVGDKPFPERERFCMRVVDTEDFDALVGPEQDNVLYFLPQRLVIVVVVVERVNVLVLLGRVFRKLDASVRLVVEPFRMALHVRVVGATVERDVECKAEPLLAGGLRKVLEILHGAEFGVHVVMAAVLVSHCIRTSRFQRFALLVGLRVQGIVRALPVRDANRVNRHQVNRIEPEVGDVVELLLAILPRSALLGVGALALGPHLIPRADAAVARVHTELHYRAFRRHILRFLGPGANLVFVIADAVDRERAFPEVVVHKVHGSLLPLFLARVAVENRGVVLLVAVAENVRLQGHGIARFALEHKTAALDAWADIFNDEIFFEGRNCCHNTQR